MKKLEKLNQLLSDSTLDLHPVRRKVDAQGSNIKWLKKHLAIRNQEHTNYEQIVDLLYLPIGELVKSDFVIKETEI